MSESAEFLPPPEFDITPPPVAGPEILIGAASPLWAYYMGAAAGGVAFWWMTRWAQPENLEAMFGLSERTWAASAEAAPAVVQDAAENLMAASETAAEDGLHAAADAASVTAAMAPPELPPAPIGGEAAPISPVVATTAEAPDAAEPAPAGREAGGAETAAAVPPRERRARPPAAEPSQD